MQEEEEEEAAAADSRGCDTMALLPQARASPVRNFTADNGGVFIASRWPITKEKQKVFDNYDGITSDALFPLR